MKSLLKALLFLCFLFPGKTIAQCPVAGSDSSATYCWHEGFDLSNVLASDADSGGIFLNPYGDTINPPHDTLSIPGVYTYMYIVSDSACENDTAELVVTIDPCFIGGINEVSNESILLAYPNPAIDNLVLNDGLTGDILIYDEHGKCVFRQSAPLTSVIDISQFEPGLYLLTVQQDGMARFQRFVKIAAP
ncbi:MAG: T9SS type A sorting domain-containing protein [Bacteroidota bacterium]